MLDTEIASLWACGAAAASWALHLIEVVFVIAIWSLLPFSIFHHLYHLKIFGIWSLTTKRFLGDLGPVYRLQCSKCHLLKAKFYHLISFQFPFHFGLIIHIISMIMPLIAFLLSYWCKDVTMITSSLLLYNHTYPYMSFLFIIQIFPPWLCFLYTQLHISIFYISFL